MIRYEDLTQETKCTVKEICSFCNIKYRKYILDMDNQPGWEGTNSSFAKR
jgi:hypothetical protein